MYHEMTNQRPDRLEWLFPSDPIISMIVWATFSAGVGLLVTLLGTTIFRYYGFALFCGTPLVMGIIAPLFHGLGAERRFRSLLAANLLSQICLFAAMLGSGAEGIGCLIMCAPLWLGCAIVG